MVWERIKEYYCEHKTEIIIAGAAVVVIGACIALGIRYRKGSLVTSQLIKQIGTNTKVVTNAAEAGVHMPVSRSAYSKPFDVSSHVRTLPSGWNASLEKQAIAKAMGYELQPGQTLVSGYVKGRMVA